MSFITVGAVCLFSHLHAQAFTNQCVIKLILAFILYCGSFVIQYTVPKHWYRMSQCAVFETLQIAVLTVFTGQHSPG